MHVSAPVDQRIHLLNLPDMQMIFLLKRIAAAAPHADGDRGNDRSFTVQRTVATEAAQLRMELGTCV
jgi:hypothetical protein